MKRILASFLLGFFLMFFIFLERSGRPVETVFFCAESPMGAISHEVHEEWGEEDLKTRQS
ncbi:MULTISPECIES: hypothetical protein [unclassified Pseudomonas]|uniref:hypothetical protein n=1 Tax=unclassified Pseudomonas TaxID=196821 RepID=UPI00114628EF|nr:MULTISPECIES: hypothetical protein [unclassified Pseudomonas]QOF86067.1 hypothetical protein IG194_05050 [Pseudomonas sp. ADPe]